jgi:hypothetical protein
MYGAVLAGEAPTVEIAFSGKTIVSFARKIFSANPSHPAIYRHAQHDEETDEKQVVSAISAWAGKIHPGKFTGVRLNFIAASGALHALCCASPPITLWSAI